MLTEEQIKRASKRAIANILSEGVTDVALVEKPFERNYLKDKGLCSTVINIVSSRILANDLGELKLSPLNHILIPKKKYADYRDCALVDILDETIFLTLVISIAKAIERSRIPKKVNRILSYRVSFNNESGIIFDQKYTYTNFLNVVASLKAAPQHNVMASCDIANFYDRLNLHRLNSVLNSLPNVDKDIANLIDRILLFWSNSNSYGLPVGSNASRILAEAELIEVDNYLNRHGVTFCRFVDDFRIFGETAQEVDEGVERLVKSLRREGLFLNPSKTRIEDISHYTERNPDQERLNHVNSVKNNGEIAKPTLIVAGYSGTIPLKFRSPSESEKSGLLQVEIDELIQSLQSAYVIEEKEYKRLLRAIAVQQRFDTLDKVIPLTDKSPQFIPYTVDFLIKHADSINQSKRAYISAHFKTAFSQKIAFPYKLVSLAQLFSAPQFEDMRFIVDAYLDTSRSSGGEIGRLLLQSIGTRLTRLEALEIRDCANSVSGISELRMLAKVASDNLPPEECRPFLSNLSTRTGDPFLKEMARANNKKCQQ